MPATPRGWAQWYGDNEQRVHRRRWDKRLLCCPRRYASLVVLVIRWMVQIWCAEHCKFEAEKIRTEHFGVYHMPSCLPKPYHRWR